MQWKTLHDFDVSNKRVLLRVDINVPLENGQVRDATRIEKIVPTVRHIVENGGKPILLAHFGRPKGDFRRDLSLQHLHGALEQAFGYDVVFVANCIGPAAETACELLKAGKVLLLENTRFHPEEEQNDLDFAQKIAALGDIYCNDAFSAAHRAHASTEGVARYLPSCAGLLMAAELQALEQALGSPERPVTAVVGGAKVSTKLELLGNLISKVDHLVIGGGMANTFLAAQGHDVGASLAEHDMTQTALKILSKASDVGCEIILPSDIVIAKEFKAHAPSENVDADQCPSDGMILDAGPRSIEKIIKVFQRSRTVIWNGPLGAFELAPFDAATNAAALEVANLSAAQKLVSVAGGGDTVAALNAAGAAEGFTYVSTAGGAFLEWMEGKDLPGVEVLKTSH